MRTALLTILALGCAACSEDAPGAANGVLPPGPATSSSALAADALPPALRALVEQSVPGMTIAEAERKEREGRVYYDIEGTRPDGSEVELDILEQAGSYRLVEIQRDIAWDQAPPAAIAAAKAAPGAFEPERVIESSQTDGGVIYELFAPGRPEEPAMEVRMRGGKAEVLGQRWAH